MIILVVIIALSNVKYRMASLTTTLIYNKVIKAEKMFSTKSQF